MPDRAKRAATFSLRPRFRVMRAAEVALGPGKIELLKMIEEVGSIAQAAKALDMSYMRAWTLIRTMNAEFREPVVAALRGGKQKGGATLTETGRVALRLYAEMEQLALAAVKSHWAELRRLLRS